MRARSFGFLFINRGDWTMRDTVGRSAALLCSAPLATIAHGQDLSMFNAYNTMGINIANTVGLNAAAMRRPSASRARPTASGDGWAARDPSAAYDQLSFAPDASISRDVKRATEAVVRADPAKEQHIRKVMASSDVLADFDRDMAPYGFHPTTRPAH